MIIRLVQVGHVKYSYTIIKNIDDLILVKDYLLDEIDTIDNIMPSIIQYNVMDKYSYRNVKEAKDAFRLIMNDTINNNIPLDFFLRYLRRFYIVSGLAESDKEVVSRLRYLFELAMYLKLNEEE
jgi:hypothetical protein